IAVLKVESDHPLPFVSFGNSDTMRVGDWVLAIGNPLGQGFSVSAGIVSARGRTLSGKYDDFIQTDAAINRGNSGGPLFNLKGEVIGVNTAILSPSGGSIGIGFSMASAVVENVVNQLREFGETRRGWLGVRIQDISEEIAETMGLESVAGALITDVPEGPALDAGLETGDVILTFDGKEVTDTRELVSIVAEAPVGGTVRVVIFRDGNTQTVLVTLGLLEEAILAAAETDQTNPLTPAPEQLETHGMVLAALTEAMRDRFMIGDDSTGVVILEVNDGSEVAEKGLRPGDVIVEVAQAAVATPSEVLERINSARDAGRRSILLLVRSQGSGRFVALSLTE
ncbi:MAG: PDZ domain-containing protein, partial [Rhodobacteraceae bacterium]|nr:PDZ domain-containing protein [Paracoccaceae bacterium]